MRPEFWHERWRTAQIGFHQATVDSSLMRLWPRLSLDKGSRVFVPLSGKSLDLVWLRDQGHFVVAVELSATAVEAFLMENGVPARRRGRGGSDVYEAPGFELIRGDFFEMTPALLGEVAAIYDRAALISWAPELRARYAEHIAKLSAAGTQMLLVALEYPQQQTAGPPFSLNTQEVTRLYSAHFSIAEISRRDILANDAHLRGRGLTELYEVCYHLVRS